MLFLCHSCCRKQAPCRAALKEIFFFTKFLWHKLYWMMVVESSFWLLDLYERTQIGWDTIINYICKHDKWSCTCLVSYPVQGHEWWLYILLWFCSTFVYKIIKKKRKLPRLYLVNVSFSGLSWKWYSIWFFNSEKQTSYWVYSWSSSSYWW